METSVIVLVTGISGVGKSALARHLSADGERAISLDANTDLCRWANPVGEPVTRPAHPTLGWLRQHRWCWDPAVLDALIAAERQGPHPRTFLCGTSDNQLTLLDRFDTAIMLDIPATDMLARLHRPDRGNDFGRVGATARRLTERYATDRARMRTAIPHIIDAAEPLAVVAARVRAAADKS
jgi:hypothetical protein